MSSPLDSIIAGNQLPSQTPVTGSQKELDKNAFLNLMVQQMQNQDPLNPMDNQAMLSQIAQFSSLEQMSNLNKNFVDSAAMSSFMEATRLLGKEVELLDPSSTADNPSTLTSLVQSVTHTANGPVLRLENGAVTGVEQILRVNEPS